MLILLFCIPPRFNSALASAFHDSVSWRFGTGRWWILSSQDLNLSMRLLLDSLSKRGCCWTNQVSLQYYFLYTSESLAFDGIQCSVSKFLWSSILTLHTPFRIISAILAASTQYSSSVHIAFEEGRPALALWYSNEWILFSWMCLSLTVANYLLQKSQRTWRSFFLWTNLLRPLYTNSTCNISWHCCGMQICQVG